MVSSPMYDRLMKFVEGVEESRKLSGYDTEHSMIIAGMGMMSASVSHFKEYQGFEGQTGEAIDGWIDQTQQRYSSERQGYVTGTEHYVEGRRLLMHAAEDAKLLSPTLLDKATEAMRGLAQVVIPVAKHMGPLGEPINTIATTGAAYVDAIEAQANAQREAAATVILQRVNDEAQKLADQLQAHTERVKSIESGKAPIFNPADGPSVPSVGDQLNQGNMWVSPHEAGVYGASRDDDYGRSDLRGQGSGLYADGYDEGGPISDRVMSSKRIPNQYISEGELGSRLNPVTDPQDLMDIDLLHTRVNGDRHANGVIGGHTPASPVDRDHPLWRLNGGPASESSTAGRLGGAGVLGAGALGLRGSARMGSAASIMGRAGGVGTGVGSSAGSTALRTGSYSGAGFGKYTPPAPAGATGAGANGTSGVTGTSGASGASGTGSSATGGRTQGTGGFMGAGGAGAGGKKDEKKAQRRRYTPFRFEDDDELPEGYVNPLSQTYGSDKDLSPAPRKDDGWDPRQW